MAGGARNASPFMHSHELGVGAGIKSPSYRHAGNLAAILGCSDRTADPLVNVNTGTNFDFFRNLQAKRS